MERHGGGNILAERGEGVKKYFSLTMEEEEEGTKRFTDTFPFRGLTFDAAS